MSSATTRRCHGCGFFHPKSDEKCPDCGTPAHGFNKGLRKAQLDSHLRAMASSE